MATTYLADAAKTDYVARTHHVGTTTEKFSFTIATNFAAADVLKLAKIPANAWLLGFFIDVPALDAAGTNTVNFSVGDATSNTTFLPASITIGRNNTGGKISSFDGAVAATTTSGGASLAAIPVQYTSASDLRMVFGAASNQTGGTIKGFVTYTLEEP